MRKTLWVNDFFLILCNYSSEMTSTDNETLFQCLNKYHAIHVYEGSTTGEKNIRTHILLVIFLILYFWLDALKLNLIKKIVTKPFFLHE
jgi:hypothetical protein